MNNIVCTTWPSTAYLSSDGAKPRDEFCENIDDRASVNAIIEELAKEQKVMVDEDDGMVYLQ